MTACMHERPGVWPAIPASVRALQPAFSVRCTGAKKRPDAVLGHSVGDRPGPSNAAGTCVLVG